MFVRDIIDLARQHLVTEIETTKLIEVAGLLTSGSGIVLVTDAEGVLQGVVTKTDIVRQISVCEGATCLCPVANAMTRDVAVCNSEDALKDVSRVMKERHLKSIPVVDKNNTAIGVLTASAVLRTLLGDVEFEEAQLINYVKGVGYL